MKLWNSLILLSIFSFCSVNAAQEDEKYENRVLYFPGIFESGEEQVSHYTQGSLKVKQGAISFTQEHAQLFSGKGVNICRFSEIVDPDSSHQYWTSRASRSFFNRFWPWKKEREGRHYARTGNDLAPYEIDVRAMNFCFDVGGENDVQRSKNFLNEHLKTDEDEVNGEQSITMGVSRGASCLFSALTCISKKVSSNISCVLLESPFASRRDVLPRCFSSCFSDRPTDPIKVFERFPDVPSLFVTSEADTRVPMDSVVRLSTALASQKKDLVYMLVLKNSSHKGYSWEDEQDRQIYEKIGKQFLARFNPDDGSDVSTDDLDGFQIPFKKIQVETN